MKPQPENTGIIIDDVDHSLEGDIPYRSELLIAVRVIVHKPRKRSAHYF
jgi:hypothetical protein